LEGGRREEAGRKKEEIGKIIMKKYRTLH